MVLTLVVMATGCGSEEAKRPAAPEPPPSFGLTMREYSYAPSVAPDAIPAGRVNFTLRNDGDLGHQPALVFVPDDFPPMSEQVRGDERRPVRILANNAGIPVGVTTALAVDLQPGQRYAFLCLAKADEGKQHSQLGMAWEFRTPGEPAVTTTTAPAPAGLEVVPQPTTESTGGAPAQP